MSASGSRVPSWEEWVLRWWSPCSTGSEREYCERTILSSGSTGYGGSWAVKPCMKKRRQRVWALWLVDERKRENTTCCVWERERHRRLHRKNGCRSYTGVHSGHLFYFICASLTDPRPGPGLLPALVDCTQINLTIGTVLSVLIPRFGNTLLLEQKSQTEHEPS